MVVANKVKVCGQMVNKIIVGEQRAINEVYNYIILLCRSIARKKIFKINRYELDSLCHDVATEIILNKLHKYDTNKPFAPWLRVVISNKIVDIFRKENRTKNLSLEQTFETHSGDYLAVISKQNTSTPEQLIIEKEDRNYVHLLLMQLSETDKSLVEGFYLEGKSIQELATEKISCNAVSVRLFRAKKLLYGYMTAEKSR